VRVVRPVADLRADRSLDAAYDKGGRPAPPPDDDAGAHACPSACVPRIVGRHLVLSHSIQAAEESMNMRTKEDLQHVIDAQVPSADYIPFGRHAAPNVVKLKRTGDYIAIWRLEGISFETSDPADILARKEGLHNYLQTLGGGKF